MTLFQELRHLLKKNIREYGMYIALLVIVIAFGLATDGLFISPRNISTLLNQTGYIMVLAVGMTLIIVCQYIDLSVGYLAGFSGRRSNTINMVCLSGCYTCRNDIWTDSRNIYGFL